MGRAERGRTESLNRGRPTVSVTCIADGWAHRVPDIELTSEMSQSDGYYQAVCGHRVAAASMVEPDGRPCPLCTEMCRTTRS
ncbi:MAG: hypothetical protein QOG20_6414 [Pseudonocardiales bacterium]|jgi:hypothetical protein|nr:hypothetical protein [Pseudonocardia sp.]MDT7616185.1 hypothetical protein [Pseudonocardiales bacterium]MDT7710807.1 hypothetical protein [Pseudonocardiales bacterium]